MNILQIVPALESGGVETGTIDLALSLKSLRQTVVIISNGGRLTRELDGNGVLHIKLPVHKKCPMALISHGVKIARVIRERQIDIVHASSRAPAWAGLIACKLTGTPFVTSCHGFYSRHIYSSVMGRGKLVMVISKSIENRMIGAFNVPKKKIRLVYRGVDLAKYPYLPDKYTEEKTSFKIMNIGRLTPIKGQYEFMEAMKLVTDKMGKVEAWIVGGAGKKKEAYLRMLKARVKELGIEKHVRFLGLRQDIYDLLKRADCLVLSTNVPEGFGRTVIEAGASGTAVCASESGGIKEIITSGASGILFPPRDSQKMAEAIMKMLGDIKFRRKCAANLRRVVEEKFTLEKMARATLAVYKEAVD